GRMLISKERSDGVAAVRLRRHAVGSGLRVDAIDEVVVSLSSGPPPHVAAIDRRARGLDANERPQVGSWLSRAAHAHMPDDDFRVVVGRDGGRGAGARVIVAGPVRWRWLGVGSIVLLELEALRRHRPERAGPRTVLVKGVLSSDEAGRCDRRIPDGPDRQEKNDYEPAQDTAPTQRVALGGIHGGASCTLGASAIVSTNLSTPTSETNPPVGMGSGSARPHGIGVGSTVSQAR